ncbi:pre-mRNA cleavage complex 2 protein Pcf11 isoform X3 [Prionailurus viverrinus]|nr:pre-mRNA cleavage complex 2 protein Pcf11 isoform X3 [Felis catus]XP_030189277.1 pre-mRNA cleavage complex 2 protein Pcf11 isoform X3 [Lynx canadensis]XP_040345435.1 pre-mRNA cleavage complex 2 protein Pcf11 isoform X3 [Puma yagouaroundi]XP_043436031.1 pre-mRNA cleavage complex 2 protein Pcf11 isoform X3 [Prionailurus bengalensis]XP_046928511.1 pre-mRNA cleavage complex 2 protein Pcf11 isoform X3 [Lynx rufus]XP_047733143.1 pre-mRNA cleavage complex 2 protein Pcf11 isoform X3 [Prionailurus v
MSEQTPAEAGTAGAREDACRDYQSSLEDLTFNSKPHINMLTILAEENLPFAKEIVSLIEAQTAKAPSSEKLPVMYLMDSIVKNVGREYLTAFTKNLVATFICVFEKVDENTRKSLFKLRSTWDEIFPLKKLYALDVRVNSLDPAWPIKPLPPNVNTSSIHVNPKFLNKSPEEPSTPGTVVSSPSISTPPIVPDIQKNLTQEQLIRQQLLAKQKQLLELQQKKLELELEQAKAQLAVSLSVQQETSNLGPGSAPSKLHVPQIPPLAVKPPHQVPVQPEKSRPGPSLQIQDLKGTNRDPRLNRMSQHSSHGKDQSHRKEFLMNTLNQSDIKTSKTVPSEKLNSSKQEKSKSGEKITKKELDQLDSKSKSKSKSPSPLKNKLSHTKDLKNQESESARVSDMSKRDPRLKKHLQDKTDSKDDDVKDKRKTAEKKDKDEHMKSSEHRLVGSRNKIINGIVQKQDTITEESEKQGTKPGRSSTRKRSRSRSPKSRSPIIHSPKRRDRRSPKRRQRSMSPSSTPKAGKIRQSGVKQSHMEEFTLPSREERNAKRSNKQDIRDPRRIKKTEEERPQEAANQHSTKSGTEPKENIENWQSSKSTKRWKSGWEENKSLQQGDEHSKSPHLRHRESWSSTKGILSPRTPKQQHRLSVDANLQIPKELTLASKRELLQKTSERLASGEITQDEFLVVVHQIRQLFQYQEGVREEQRSPFNDRFPLKRPRYEDSDKPFVDSPASRFAGLDTNQRLTALAEDRPLFDGPSRPSVTRDGPTKMIFEGPNKLSPRIDGPPTPGSLRFDGSPGQMGGGGPLRFEGPQGQLGGGCPLRFEGPPGPVGTPLRFEGPIGQAGGGGFRFEGSPGLRFEGSAGGLRFEGPGGQPVGGLRFEGHRGQPVGGLRFEGPHGQPVGGLRFDNPRGQPVGGLRFEGGHGPSGAAIRFDGPHGQPAGGIRFEGPLLQQGVGMRFEGPHGQSVAGLRFEGQHNQLGGNLRFEGPHGQPGVGIRFEGPLVQQGGGMRFEGPSVPGGGLRIEGPLGQGGPRFEGCHALRFDGQPGQPSLLPRFDGLHGQPGPRFERTGQPGPQRFDGPPGQQVQPRFDGVPQRFDGPQHQQASRFDIPLGLQSTRFDNHPSQRLESVSFNQSGPYNDPPGNAFNAPSQGLQFQRHEQMFDSPQGPNFNGPHGPGNQSFSNPLNRASGHYFDEKNLQSSQFGNFGNLPAPITVGNIQASQQVLTGVAQPVAFGQGQQFLPVHPQNPGAFVQNPSGALPKAYPDNHLSQVDVNELFSKLLKTGILKLSQPDSATTQVNEVAAQPAPEEEEDQNEDQDVPDLTNFTIEELKQRYDSVINRLYTGIQCYSCGMRFTTSQTDVYADHLDWHYRQNRTEKDVSRKVTHRRWYYSLTDWIEFEEIADLEERAKSQFFEKVHEEVVLKTQEAAKEKEFQSVPAGPAGAVESCEICQEQFEQYWDEEEEEWHLKNAIRVDGKIYHPSCYEDYQNTSSFDCTPSPSKTPVENPLNIMLNIVKNELQEPCESPKVKEERIDTPPACTEESIATPTEIKTESDTVESV